MSLEENLTLARAEKARVADLYWSTCVNGHVIKGREEEREKYQSWYCTALTIVQDLEFRLDRVVSGYTH